MYTLCTIKLAPHNILCKGLPSDSLRDLDEGGYEIRCKHFKNVKRGKEKMKERLCYRDGKFIMGEVKNVQIFSLYTRFQTFAVI